MPNIITANITANGQAAIAASIAGTRLVITRVAVGSGVAGNPTNLTALVNQTMNLTTPQVSANVVAPDEVMILATLDSLNAPTASFNLTEIGVFATSGGGAELLLAYYQCATPGDIISQQTGLSRLQIFFSLPIQVGVGSATAITVVAGNPLYIPPVVAGTGIIVTAPTDASGNVTQWIVSTATITQTTTLFVKAGNNNVAPNFSNVQNAINYLNGFNIASGVGIGISVAAGTYQGADATWTLNHINGNQITISGAANPDISFTAVAVASGSAGAWNVTYSGLSSTANLVAGGWVIVWNAGSTVNWSQTLLCGCFSIVSVAGSSVTLRIPYSAASWPPITCAGTMTPLTTIFWVNANTNGMIAYGAGIGRLANVAFISKGLAANLYFSGVNIAGSISSTIQRVGVNGWRNNVGSGGFSISGAGGAYLQACGSSNNGSGVTSGSTATVTLGFCGLTHNLVRGLWGESAVLNCYPGQPVQIGGNLEHGILLSSSSLLMSGAYIGGSSTFTDSYIFSTYHNSANCAGCFMVNGSITRNSSPNDELYLTKNAAYDLIVGNLSIASAPIAGTRIFNIAVNTLTLQGIITG